jgi:TolB-like protein/tetratricopeptide (TPR) repeat protein
VNLRNFFDELSRRHVVRATVGYCVAAWVVIEVVSTIAPLLGLSEGVPRFFAFAAIALLPVAILLAWFFDLTRSGVRRTAQREPNGADPGALPRRRLAAHAFGLVGLGIVITLVGVAAFNVRARSTHSDHIESIAVLPFADLSPGQDQEYFTDGVTEELMNRLARTGIRVASRTSTFAFKGQNPDIATIARELRVEAILEGSIRRDGNRLRISAKLIDATDGVVLWSDSFERTDSSIFAIQDEISGAIVDALRLKLAGDKRTGSTNNLAAQELYFKGLKALHGGTDPQLRAALQFFDQAIALDSAYALAYAGLAKTYAVLPAFGDYPVNEALNRGNLAASRAILLQSDLGEAYAARGQIAQNLEWDLQSALAHYTKALRTSPNDAATHQWYAEALLMTGKLENAHTEITRALEIDPVSATAQNLRAYHLLLRGDAANALRVFQLLLREKPDFRFGHLNFAFAALAAREYGDAVPALVAAFPQFGPEVGAYVAAASGQGERPEAIAVVERLALTEHASVVALLYAAIGDHESALQALETSLRSANDANLPYWLLHPILRPLHQVSRFQKIVRDVGVSVR